MQHNYALIFEVNEVSYCYFYIFRYYKARQQKKYKNKSFVAAATEETVMSIMDKESAKFIIDTLEEANKKIFSLVPYIQENCTAQEIEKLKRQIANMGTFSDSNIYPIILEQYPELDPLEKNK